MTSSDQRRIDELTEALLLLYAEDVICGLYAKSYEKTIAERAQKLEALADHRADIVSRLTAR